MQVHELLVMLKADVIALANEQSEILRDARKIQFFAMLLF